jgi:hypothetical protein
VTLFRRPVASITHKKQQLNERHPMTSLRSFRTVRAVAMAAALTAGWLGAMSLQAQQSDIVIFGPASNPGGLVGYVQSFETNAASEFNPAFLPAAANVQNNIGVQLYEDASQSVVSDQIWTQAGYWYFASDPNLIDFAANGIALAGSLVEDGTQQDVSAYFLLPTGSMTVMSDVSDVPEPASLGFLGLGGGLWLLRLRQRGRRG